MKQFNPDLRHRESLRLKDYTGDGMYYATVCTHNKRYVFDKVIDEQIHLSAIEEIVNKRWNRIPIHHDHTSLNQFVVMPNYVHGILTATLWKGNYYEHIIRNERELNLIPEYIVGNPLQWKLERENPAFNAKADGEGSTETLNTQARHTIPLKRNCKKIRVLFLCLANSCRSQMAEGLLRHIDPDSFEVRSAGTAPSHVHPKAIDAMAELGIDISSQRSKHTREFSGERFNYVISLCGEDNCPAFLGEFGKSLHWPFPDPVSAAGNNPDALAGFRKVRDDIKNKLREFAKNPASFS